MDKKNDPKAKAGVKFADSKAPVANAGTNTARDKEEKPKVVLSLEDCRSTVIKIFNEADTAFKLCTKNDPEVKRKDTARALCKVLESLKEALTHLNNQGTENKEKLYYLTYNGTIYIFEICRTLRKSVYSALTIQHIAYCILSMEKNLTLLGVKFLDWRVKLYIELAHIYEECDSYKASSKVIETGIAKVNELKELEESDPPVPEHTASIIANNLRILKAMDVKYKLHTAVLNNGDAWKKKIEEYFKTDIEGRNIAIIESLNQNYKKHNNIVSHQGKNYNWKDGIVTVSYDLVKADIELVSKALEQINNRMNMTIQIDEDKTLNEQTRTEIKGKLRELENTMFYEKDWKKASNNVPLELHIELLKHAYDVNNMRVYGELLQTALQRCKYRRIEVPYIEDIEISFSDDPHSNVENGYERIEVDINEAHLRIELQKLRLSIAKEIAKQQEEKKLEKLKDQGKKGTKKDEKEEKPVDPNSIQVDPSRVAHKYIHFLIKRSYSPARAIYGCDIVMAPAETGPKEKLAQGWVCKAIYIDQYTGVRETTGLIPFLCLKHSEESLKNEEEKKTLLVDFLPILAKSHLARPKFGYERINVDLKQVPQQFYKIPNLDFVFTCFKNDRMFPICERELYIIKHLEEVEKSYRGTKTLNDDEEVKALLDVNYDIAKLMDLAKVVKNSLDGPLGDYFFEARKDFLVKFAFHIWKKYIVSTLYQMETLYELRITEEISAEEFRKYESLLVTIKQTFVEVLESLSQIMMRSELIDVVWVCKIDIELCKLLEEFEEYRKASQILRFTYNKLTEYKDRWFSRGVESKKDIFLPLTVTCNNIEIHKMIEEMKNKYYDWKAWLRKEVRAKTRERLGTKALDEDEAQEEDAEYVDMQRTYGLDDLKDQNYIDSINFDKAFSEYFAIINAIHTDVTANLIRCELKAGKMNRRISKMKHTDKYTTTLKNPEGIDSIPARLKARLNIMSGATTLQVKKNATQLQTTLQTAGKLEPPKPKIQFYEEELIKEGNNNSYFNALLYMTMAGCKSKYPEQKYLLNEAIKYIKQAEEEERMHIKNGIENAVYLFSTLLDDRNAEKNNEQFYPFDHIYNPTYIKLSTVPPKPVFISRTTNSITLKLPPFNPIIGEIQLLENPSLKIVNLMSIYGKVSQNGVECSLTSTELQNTGTRFKNGAIVTITNLRANEKYCFAAAGYNPQERVINGIGKTGEDIAAVNPLPVNMLYAYLAMNAYQIGYFELAEEASERSGNFFCEKTEIKERSLDYADNPIYLYRLKSESVKNFSQVELKIAALNYIVHARCLQRKFAEQEKNSKNPVLYITKQKNALMVCNYLMLALELSCITKSFPVAKRVIKELYNDVLPFFSFRTKSKFVYQILLKAQLLICQIPKEIWDGNLRNCSVKITYEILRMTLQFNEIKVSKLLLYYESKLPHRKWFTLSKTIMIEEAPVVEATSKDKKDLKNKPKSKGQLREEVKPSTSELPKLIPKTVREILAKQTLQDNLEEFLLSLGEEYYDAVLNFIETWKEQLEIFKPYIDNGPEVIDKKKAELLVKYEFWDLMRDLNPDIAKIKPGPQCIEFVCKCLRKAMDKGNDINNIINQANKVVEPTSETITLVNQIRDLRLKAIEGDIGWNPRMLEELIHEREINKQGDDLAIELYTQFWKLDQELREKSAFDQNYEYNMKWLAEFNFIKATLLYIQLYRQLKIEAENKFEVFFDVTEIGDPEMINQPDSMETERTQNKIDKARMDQITNIYKLLCFAATYALRAKTFYLLQNISKLSLNVLKIEMVTPFDHQGSDFYKYFTHLCENLNEMLEKIKEKQDSKAPSEPNSQLASAVRFEEIKEESPMERRSVPSNAYLLDTYLTKDYWFWQTDIDVQTIANNIAYCTKSLTVEKRWRAIVECTKHFCNVLHQFYSIYILPFTENAQKMLFEAARERTNAKRKQLEDRTKVYDEWRKKRKKKGRAEQMTGAIPQEQLDFERDEAELKKQIEIHKRIEDFYDADRKRSADLLKIIKRDENQALENLNQGRNILAKYGNDLKELSLSSLKNAEMDPANFKLKEKSSEFWYRTVTSKYKEIIEVLKKKQENVALVQALHERGNVHFTMGEPKKFMQDWNEALDTIFQRIYSLKNFREVLNEYKNLGFQIGVERCLIGAVLLYKLGNFGYYNDIHSQMECSLMAYELIFAIFKISMPHHFIPISFGSYRVKEILQDKDIFGNKYMLNPGDLIMACNYHALSLMDNGHHLKALPVLGLMEYLAADITMSPYYSVKAKILKAICLAQCGYINEAYSLLLVVTSEKDIVMGLNKNSEYYKKESGYNYTPNAVPYLNEFSPYDDRNKEAIENIFKLEIPSKFRFKYGFINYNLYYFAKAAIIFSIYEVENFDKADLNEIRISNLRKTEGILRSILKRLAFEDEYFYLKDRYSRVEKQEIASEEGTGPTKEQQAQQLKLIKYYINNLFDANEIEEVERPEYQEYRETTLKYSEVREERVSMIMRIRFFLATINTSMNFSTRSYHIVKQGIINLKKFADDQRRIESGDEPGVPEDIKPEDPKGKKGDSKSKPEEKKKEEKKEEKKKDKKNLKPGAQAGGEDEPIVKTEEELAKEFEEDQKILKKEAHTRKSRNLLNGFWWLKLRTLFCTILFKQNKLDDCQALINLFREDSKYLKDTYFVRTLEELEAKILLKKGNTTDGLRKLRKVIQHGTSYHHTDIGFGNVVGDFADVLFEKGDTEESEQNYRMARQIFNNLLFEIRFEFKPQNTNHAALTEELKVCRESQIQDIENTVFKSDKLKTTGKKDDKKAPARQEEKKKQDPKAKGKVDNAEALAEMDVLPLNPLPNFDYSKENKYNFDPIDENFASNKLPLVYSLKLYESYVKATLNYIRCILWKSDYFWDQNTIVQALDEVNHIIQSVYNIPLSFRFQMNFLYGKAFKRKFIEEFKRIHKIYEDKYLEDKVKKYKRLHTKVPHRDLLRNTYMIDIPNFSEELKDTLIPYLEQAKDYLKKATALLKTECLVFENGIKVEEAFIELAQVVLYLREYRVRPTYKYYRGEDIAAISKDKKLEEIEKHLAELEKSDQKNWYDLEWEAFNYLTYAIQVSQAKQKLEEEFSVIGQTNFIDASKMPQDVFQMILESDFQQKKTYGPKLFDENKKKTAVSSIDTLLYLNRLARESSLFSFSNNTNQRLISKLHRFLRAQLANYAAACTLPITEVQPRSDAKANSLSEGTIICKVFENPRMTEHRMIYLFGPLNKDKLKPTLNPEELNKLIMNPENDVLYGSLYFGHNEISELLQQCYDLKSRMEHSDKCSKDVRERDYKTHKYNFMVLIAKFGLKFVSKEATSKSVSSQSASSASIVTQQEEDDPLEILDKYEALVPELTMANIQILINLFSQIGLNSPAQFGGVKPEAPPEKSNPKLKNAPQVNDTVVIQPTEPSNHNFLALFRYFHKLKYK